MPYTFNDDEIAAARLEVVDRVFATTTERLLDRLDLRGAGAIADVGCGPGLSAARLVERFPSATVVGVDISPEFVARARDHVGPAAFVVGDATRLPLRGADALFIRFVLSHLPEPASVIAGWMGALHPGGLVLIEEPEGIETGDPDLVEYETIVTERVGRTGASVWVGPELGAADLSSIADERVNEVVELEVSAGDAARMFALNLRSWIDDESRYRPRHGLADLLDRLEARGDDERRGVILWRVRHLVLGAPTTTVAGRE